MFSRQPGARIPRRYGPFPARDDDVACLERYAAGMRLKFGTAVGRIGRAGPGWELELGDGRLSAAHVVVATGPDAGPVMPGWPGMAGYRGGCSSTLGSSGMLARWPAGTSLSWARGTLAWTC
jgi:putative flavoprotein involved in K+ transport